MEDHKKRILELLHRYENNEATPHDISELEAWYESFEHDEKLSAIKTPEERAAIRDLLLAAIDADLDEHFLMKPAQVNKKKLWLWPTVAAAASILVFLSVGLYLMNNRNTAKTEIAQIDESKYLPGSNKAVLTLSNGQKIILDDVANGKLASQGGNVVSKTADGEVIYEATPRSAQGKDATGSEVVHYNTMTTPRGGQFHLTLADGTGVWLNAQSSITYPAHFKGNSREVQTTGEIYFEVAHDAKKPFVVKSRDQSVQVLGTHFNINAYENENAIRTTLLEGSVKVSALSPHKGDLSQRERGTNSLNVVLKPNQQAILLSPSGRDGAAREGNINVKAVDTDEIMAWQRGYFDFTQADIHEVMRQISRWYDLDVSFKGPLSKETFSGKIPRSWNLGQVLKIIRASQGVKITIEGRRIMVEG